MAREHFREVQRDYRLWQSALGHNNHNKNYAKLENVNTFRFMYKGTIRIIFTAMKNIQRGFVKHSQ